MSTAVAATGSSEYLFEGKAPPPTAETVSADRFLKLLVAQMQNQDPLNPLDNAQVTTQMAQINTVTGIDKLNKTVAGLNGQFVQMQALQAAGLVGRTVQVAGDRMGLDSSGVAGGGFELAGAAKAVRVDVLDASGRVIDSLALGARDAGRHSFDWTPPEGVDAASASRFRVVAANGSEAVAAVPLMRDRVEAVTTAGDSLLLELARSGPVAWADVKAFN